MTPGYSAHAIASVRPRTVTKSSTRERMTIRRTGGAIAATSRPWYLRVFSETSEELAYPPCALAHTHSRSIRSWTCSSETSVGPVPFIAPFLRDVRGDYKAGGHARHRSK